MMIVETFESTYSRSHPVRGSTSVFDLTPALTFERYGRKEKKFLV